MQSAYTVNRISEFQEPVVYITRGKREKDNGVEILAFKLNFTGFYS